MREVMVALLAVSATADMHTIKLPHNKETAKWIGSAPLEVDHNRVLTKPSLERLLEGARKQHASIKHTEAESLLENSSSSGARALLARSLRLRNYACCDDLGWNDYRVGAAYGNDRVCGGLPVELTCPDFKLNYDDASDVCTAVGADICTKTEYSHNEHEAFMTANTCTNDMSVLYWTGTDYTCSRGGGTGRFVVKQSAPTDRSCVRSSEPAYFMCCSKNYRRESECAATVITYMKETGNYPPPPPPISPPPIADIWIMGDTNQNCQTVCANNGLTCDTNAFAAQGVNGWGLSTFNSALSTLYNTLTLSTTSSSSVCATTSASALTWGPTVNPANGQCRYRHSGSNYCTSAAGGWKNLCFCS